MREMLEGWAERFRAGTGANPSRILNIADLAAAPIRSAAVSGPVLTSRLGAALAASDSPHRPEAATAAALRRALERLATIS